MLKKIRLINFEGHEDTTLDLTKGVHIISGDSNAGKSSIFRALRFVFLNEPGGEEFINFNATECSVIVDYNGNVIERTKARNNKKNEYKLNGKEFKAFGQSVPNEIQQVLQLNEINFEWQFDRRPFLISETGGYIASKLNEIVNLELIDSSLRDVESLRRGKNKEIESSNLDLKDAIDKINSYDWIEKAEEKLIEAETLEASINSLNIKNESLHSLIEQIDLIRLKFDSIAVLSDDKIKETKAIADSLISIKKDKNNIETIVSDLKMIHTRLDNVGVVLSDRKISGAKDSIEELKTIKSDISEIKSMIDKIEYTVLSISEVEREIERLAKEYKEIAPEVCPLCGNKFHKEL